MSDAVSGPGPTAQEPHERFLDQLAPGLLVAGAALVLALLFGPAVMSTDSILQYRQALAGRFDDWHPPLMAIVLSGFLATGWGLGTLALLQCLAAAFGVYRLARATLALVGGSRLSPRTRAWWAAAVLLLLLLPLSAWAIYFMTFWTDVWTMIGLVWIAGLALELGTGRAARLPSGTATVLGVRAPCWRLGGLALLMALTTTVRHNALPLLLPFGVLLAFLAADLRAGHVRRGWILVLAPGLLFAGIERGVREGFDVQHEAVGNLVMALDLVGLCAASDAVCADLPYTRSALDGETYRRVYRPGEIEPLEQESPQVAEAKLFSTAANPALAAEYRRALLRHPLALARVKLRAFAALLGIERTVYYFAAENDPEDLGLSADGRWREWRDRWVEAAWGMASRPVLRFVSAVPAVWLGVGAIWLGGLLVRVRRTRERNLALLALVLSLPLAYAATYLVAVVALDYRYLAPAVLVVQVMSISALLGRLGRVGQPGVRSVDSA